LRELAVSGATELTRSADIKLNNRVSVQLCEAAISLNRRAELAETAYTDLRLCQQVQISEAPEKSAHGIRCALDGLGRCGISASLAPAAAPDPAAGTLCPEGCPAATAGQVARLVHIRRPQSFSLGTIRRPASDVASTMHFAICLASSGSIPPSG
jgi:hypothetical protein